MALMRLFRHWTAAQRECGVKLVSDDKLRRSALRTLMALPVALAGAVTRSAGATPKSGPLSLQDTVARLTAQAAILDARAQITEVLHDYARANDQLGVRTG